MELRLPNGSVLQHAGRPYDPVKAHDYYLRVRKLKGRKKRGADKVGSLKKSRKMVSLRPVMRGPKRVTPDLTKARANAAAEVAGLRKKLHLLAAELKKRMAEAEKQVKESAKPDTAAEKNKKAKDAKQFRDKHQQSIKTKSKAASKKAGGSSKKKTDGAQSIDDLKKTIGEVATRLSAAVARQRALG